MNQRIRKLLEMDEELEKIENCLDVLSDLGGYDVKKAIAYIKSCVIPQFREQLNQAYLKEDEEARP